METLTRDDGIETAPHRRVARALRPWLRAIGVSCLFPFLLEGVDRWLGFLPEEGPRWSALFSPPDGLAPRTLVLVRVTAHLFAVLVPVIPRWPNDHEAPLFLFAARLLRRVAAGLLFFTVPLLATIWALALSSGWADGTLLAEPVLGNHGPWRRAYDLRLLLEVSMLGLPALAVIAAGFSWAVYPTLRSFAGAVVLTGGALLFFAAIVASHFWLID